MTKGQENPALSRSVAHICAILRVETTLEPDKTWGYALTLWRYAKTIVVLAYGLTEKPLRTFSGHPPLNTFERDTKPAQRQFGETFCGGVKFAFSTQ